MNKKLLIISIIILLLGILGGILVSFCFSNEIANLPSGKYNDIIGMIGYLSIPAICIYCIIVAIIIILLMWVIYGIMLLIKKIIKSNKKINYKIALLILFIIIGISVFMYYISIPKFDENTIGYIAYDYNRDKDYTVYIKESDKYIPYLVLTYNYNKTGNALLLRKNVIGGENGYTEELNGTIATDKVDNDWLPMSGNMYYYDTEVDKFLSDNFIKRFENDLLDKIVNTSLSFSDFSIGRYSNYEINRKFFVLSVTELNSDYARDNDNKTENKMRLKYFNDTNRSATNDVSMESPYWTRTSTSNNSAFYNVGYGGSITYTGTDARLGVRPAFTISNKTKIINIFDDTLSKSINIIE